MKIMLCTHFFSNLTLLLFTKPKYGFDRRSYMPLF